MARCISATETAKLIRIDLKDVFPGVKFSVRCDNYSNISITWCDGPGETEVQTITAIFSGSTFDAYTDSRTSHSSIYKGEEVYFLTHYVSTNRQVSRAFAESVVAMYCAQYHSDPAKISYYGTPENTAVNFNNLSWDQGQTLRRMLKNTSSAQRSAPKKKSTARDFDAAQRAQKEARKRDEEAWRAAGERARQEALRREEEARRRAARAEEELRRAQEARDQARREEAARRARYEQEQQRRRSEARAHSKTRLYTRADGLQFFGLTMYATDTEIKAAFAARVRRAADGRGGYTEDMDLVTTAKKLALAK